MEYDVSFHVTKLVRGKGLCIQLTDGEGSNVESDKEVVLVQDDPVDPNQSASWVTDMTNFLQTRECPAGLDRAKRRYFHLQSIPYVLINGNLFRKDYSRKLLKCIDTAETQKILFEFHDGSVGGHFNPRTIAWKIRRAGFYWPTLFKDTHSWVRKCGKCAMFVGKERLVAFPLHPILVEQPFARWGIDFIGPINPN